ncbi:hypothetical protein [Serratia marcescens]|uniref:hypothetical protein n=1 Tax=Serratia marcescens TaxID=615 RepID=UPI000E01D444|nr:hypothetical protein [Serratia marcescens]SUI40392.1 Uncharacterised protein [Serratia marcescens]
MDNKLSELSKPVAWEVKGILCHSEEEARIYVGEPEPLYSQEYVSALLAERDSNQQNYQNAMEELRIERSQRQAADQRIAELETQVNVWESAAMKHLARAEEAEKRLPILEQDKLRLNEIINSEANRADAAEKLLATPVRLPSEHELRQVACSECAGNCLELVEGTVRAAGFTVAGDE